MSWRLKLSTLKLESCQECLWWHFFFFFLLFLFINRSSHWKPEGTRWKKQNFEWRLTFNSQRDFSNCFPFYPEDISVFPFFCQQKIPLSTSRRALYTPLLLLDGSCCLFAIGIILITAFSKKKTWWKFILFHISDTLAYNYTMHLAYPRCVATLLSLLQTEMLQDSLHEGDNSPSFIHSIGI